MDKQSIDQMKNKLIEEKARIENELKRFSTRDAHNKSHFNPQFSDITDKLEESAGEVSQFADDLALEQNFEKEIKGIDHALDNIANGSYGICEVCKKEINPKRLEANPSAVTCVEHTK